MNDGQWLGADRVDVPDEGGAPGTEVAKRIAAKVEEIVGSPDEMNRRARLADNLSIYSGKTLGASELFILPAQRLRRQGTAFNMVYSIVNTVRNRICSFRPRGQFLPNGGDRMAESASRDMTAMSDAWMKTVNWWRSGALVERDSLTGDGGMLKYFREGDGEHEHVQAKRFPSWEFLVDPAEAIYGEPRCLYHVHVMPVAMAAAQYHVDEAQLRTTAAKMSAYGASASNTSFVPIIDAYARGPEGRHVIVVGDVVVIDEDWKHEGFPVGKKLFDETDTGYGFWGVGAIDMLAPLQEEMTEWGDAMREAHKLNSLQVWLVNANEDAPANINDDYVRISRYTHQPPQVINPAAVNGEMYKYGEVIEQAAYKLLGISQFIASGVKQPGVTSRVAIRETSELQSDRLALESQDYETLAVDGTEWWWRLQRDICRENEAAKPKWRAIDKGSWRELVFGDLKAEYEIRSYPTSIFGQGESGRLDRANDLIEKKFISREDAMRALDIPDLAPMTDLALSEENAMAKIVDDILEHGKYETPDPYLADPAKLNGYASARYRVAYTRDANYPRNNMALLRRLIDATKPPPPAPPTIQGMQPPPAAPGMPGAGAPPTAIPAPPPTIAQQPPTLIPPAA